MDKGWGREFQKCILKYVQKPFHMNFEPDNAALNMRLREDGMGDPSISEWQTGKKNPKIAQARACQTCREVSGASFTDFYAERWDLLTLGKESEHDIEYDQEPQASFLVRELEYAGAAVEDFMMEQSSLTDLGKTRANQKMVKETGPIWWSEKLRPRCLKYKALANGVTHGEAIKDHMDK